MTNTKLPTAQQVMDLTGRDQVTKKGDVYTVRRGFYYRHGNDEDIHAAQVVKALEDAGFKCQVLDKGEHYTAFCGGAPVQKQSHWWVKVQLEVKS